MKGKELNSGFKKSWKRIPGREGVQKRNERDKERKEVWEMEKGELREGGKGREFRKGMKGS